jgi:hypothetical protein
MPSEAGGGVRGVAVRRCPQKDSPSAFVFSIPKILRRYFPYDRRARPLSKSMIRLSVCSAQAVRLPHTSWMMPLNSPLTTIIFIETLNIPGTITSRHDAANSKNQQSATKLRKRSAGWVYPKSASICLPDGRLHQKKSRLIKNGRH